MPHARPEPPEEPSFQSPPLDRLRRLIAELEERNPFWSARLAQAGLRADRLSSLAEFNTLPLLSKQELVDDQLAHPPFGSNFTYPLARYSRVHQSSGTTGAPMRWFDTPESWDWILRCWEQIYALAGVQRSDVLVFPFSFGPFIGFWAAFEGAQRLGNRTLAMGGMSSAARIRMILDMQASVVCCTPTYGLRLSETAREEGIDLAASAVRLLIVAGEPGAATPAIRGQLESAWGARVIDHWGMTDVGSLAVEPFSAAGGMVLLDSECLSEVIDPQTLRPVASGELGELVVTNLGRWGQPVLRYRTGDLVRATRCDGPEDAASLRLEGGILGRADDMVIIRGNNVFPSSVDAILRGFSEIVEYRATVRTRKAMPHLDLEIEVRKQPQVDVPELLNRVERAFKDCLNFSAQAQVVDALPRFELKGRRFFREDVR